jgi:hypothetical protein
MKLFLYIIFFTSILPVSAQTYVQINGISAHDRSGYNGLNYGAGIETSVSDRWTVAGGWYHNSESRGSTYAYGRYAFYKKDSWNIGIAAGAVTGYSRSRIVPMAFPELCYNWLCAVAFPRVEDTGANVVGLRLRIPIN